MANIENYFNIEDAINSPTESKISHIIANERRKKNGGVGRYYTVFPSFKTFLKNREKYPNSHEIIIDHIKNKPNIAGRLVFDLDIKMSQINGNKIPKDLKKQVETVVIRVSDKFFTDVDTQRFVFIWSTSQSKEKLSKHLTVKNLYFDDWVKLTKIYYHLFGKIWDKNYTWIKSGNLIDIQIARFRGSLRMVGSSKLDGTILELDNPKHTFQDSLIRIYFRNRRIIEQSITTSHLKKKYRNFFSDLEKNSSANLDTKNNIQHIPNKIDIFSCREKKFDFGPGHISHNRKYEFEIYGRAFELFRGLCPGIFRPGKIHVCQLRLIRMKSSKCLLSKDVHDSEGGYLEIFEIPKELRIGYEYRFSFGCFREYHKKKKVDICEFNIASSGLFKYYKKFEVMHNINNRN